ncbi:hypothetical protein OAT67_04115 [Bacteriovoracaceae bacterium]|nr:hypothetical protein [Bacteriovoracaceae bacterium]
MNTLSKLIILPLSVCFLSSCEVADRFEAKVEKVSQYEKVALRFSRENRQLKQDIGDLHYEISKLKSEKAYLEIQLKKYKKPSGETSARTIASVPAIDPEKDKVKFDVFKWTPEQILSVAEKEFDKKDYEKSAQFFHSFYSKYPKNKKIDDQFLFQAGVAAFESGEHHDWSIEYFDRLISEYPTSKYYRGAKLWKALTHLKQGHKQEFFSTVEEFRKKYRNTEEWKVLSQHYEKIVQNYK